VYSIVIFGTLQDFREAGQIDTQGHGSVTAEVYKPIGIQVNGYKGDMRVVHRLELDTILGALEVCICDELLDSYV
jgi:hypothetical protein